MRWMRSIGITILCGVCAAASAGAEPATARTGLTLAAAAADAWADDARLVWIENDAGIDAGGHAGAWGYLYYSAEHHALRSWSVRDGAIVRAVDHAVGTEAPALDAAWLDSEAAAARAWDGGGREFCGSAGRLVHLVLVRGVFAAETCWCAVFENGSGPNFYVLLDAQDGGVKRRWRG